jgi:uncharacterized membrane protein
MKIEINKSKLTVLLILLVGIIGLAVSIYLTDAYSKTASLECGLGGGCDIVKNSQYATFLGISVPILGLLYYVFVVAYAASRLFVRKLIKFEKEIFLLAVTGALAFSLYLTYLEAFVIEAWCQWCIVSAVCSGLLFIFAAIDYKQLEKKEAA